MSFAPSEGDRGEQHTKTRPPKAALKKRKKHESESEEEEEQEPAQPQAAKKQTLRERAATGIALPTSAPVSPVAAAAASSSSAAGLASPPPSERQSSSGSIQLDLPVLRAEAPQAGQTPARWVRATLQSLDAYLTALQAQFGSLRIGVDTESRLSALRLYASSLQRECKLALLGVNNVGKSYLINLLLFLTMQTPMEYRKARAKDYQLEAMEAIKQTHADDKATSPAFRSMSEVELCRRSTSAHLLKERNVYAAMVLDYSRRRPDFSSLVAYLLPSQSALGNGTTTKAVIQVAYGLTIHAMVEYLTEEQARDKAFQLVQLLMDLEEPSLSYQDKQAKVAELQLRGEDFFRMTAVKPEMIQLPDSFRSKEAVQMRMKRSRALVDAAQQPGAGGSSASSSVGPGLSAAELRQHQWPGKPDEIVLSDSLTSVLDRVLIIHGRGEKLEVDRPYLRDQLEHVLHGRCSCKCPEFESLSSADKQQLHVQAAAIRAITLYVPAGIVEGRLTLVDQPGTNDADACCRAATLNGLNAAKAVLLLNRKSVSDDQQAAALLKESMFFKNNFGDANSFGQLISVIYDEREGDHQADMQYRKINAEEDQALLNRIAKITEDSTEHVRSWLEAHLSELALNDSISNSQVTRLRDQLLDQRFSAMVIYPTLFASLLEKTATLDGQAATEEQQTLLLSSTGGYQLLGTIRSYDTKNALHVMRRVLGIKQLAADGTAGNGLEHDATAMED